MITSEKTKISALLEDYVKRFPSQAKAAAKLKNVSEATVINIRKGNWDSISDDMWRTLAKQIGWDAIGAWNMAETLDFRTLVTYFTDARQFGNVFAITGPAGSGKTATASFFAAQNPNVVHVNCAEYWNRKLFLRTLLRSMGKDASGYNTSELMDEITDTLMRQDKPLLILDEADKLTDHVLYFFITLYNVLEGKCGIVLLATDYLKKRLLRGVRLNKKGYSEIYSRIGRRFIGLSGTNKNEVEKICTANGLTEPVAIAEIYNDCDGDLRRVKRVVHKKRLQAVSRRSLTLSHN